MSTSQEPKDYSLSFIAELIGAELVAPEPATPLRISGLASLQSAGAGQLTFLARADYARYLPTCAAAAVIVSRTLPVSGTMPLLKVDNPYLAYAQVSALFDSRPRAAAGVHPSALVDPSARIAASAVIGARAVVEAGVVVGEDSIIGPACVIGAHTIIGKNCLLHAHVTLYHGVVLGDRVQLHSGVVIGADGFGFAPRADGSWQKIHQLGAVRIGNDVEIGANTTIDRGAIEDTILEEGVIIDNQVQIAHNVHIGKHTAIAGCSAVAGSTRIGAHCTIAGGVGIVGHLTLVDKVHVTAMTLVTGSIDQPGSYSGGTNLLPTRAWRRNAVRFGQLEQMAKRLAELEKKS